MAWATIVTIITGTLVLAGTVIYNVRLSSKEQKVVARPNMPIIKIQSEELKSIVGYAEGVVENQRKAPNGVTVFKIYPSDVLQGEDVERPDFKLLAVKNEFLDYFAEGTILPKRQCIVVLPKHKLDLPKRMRDSLEGKYYTKESIKSYMESLVGKAIPNMQKSVKEVFDEYALGELSTSELRRRKENLEKEKPPEPKVEEKK